MAWCNMDPVAVAAHNAPEGSLAINGRTPAVGRDAIEAVAASFYQALPDMQVFSRDLAMDRGPDRVPLDLHGHEHRAGWHRQRCYCNRHRFESRRGYGRDLELQDRTEIASGEQSAGAGQSSGRPRGGVERRFE